MERKRKSYKPDKPDPKRSNARYKPDKPDPKRSNARYKPEKIHRAKPRDPSKPPHETPVGYRWGKNKSGKYAWIKKKKK